MSSNSSSFSSGAPSDPHGLIQTVQQLIDSDDDEATLKKLAALHPRFPLLKKMHSLMSNRDKLNLFLRDQHFRWQLADRLRTHNAMVLDPVIKLGVYSIRHRHLPGRQFVDSDLWAMADRFGQAVSLHMKGGVAFIRYDNYISCYLAVATLNGLPLDDVLRLSVGWCDMEDMSQLQQQVSSVAMFDGSSPPQMRKHVARFEIYMESSDFKIAKRIIGPRGNNMKKILNDALPKKGAVEEHAKIRLRGRGSGFLQGQEQTESDQVMNLCITSKDLAIFRALCESVEKLLRKIAVDYKEHFQKTFKKFSEGTAFKWFELVKDDFELVKQVKLEQLQDFLLIDGHTGKKRITQSQISRLIGLRDKARKQGRYQEADAIRQKLRRQGITLVDQKHANGKTIKTTWKYTAS